MRKSFGIPGALSLFVVFCLLACGEVKVSGGVSEETNTIAGNLVTANGSYLARTIITAWNIKDSSEYGDTTGSRGNFALELPDGTYALNAESGDLAFYKVVEVTDDAKLDAVAEPVDTLLMHVSYSDGSIAQGVELGVPGTNKNVIVDEAGYVTLAFPQGNVALFAESQNPKFESAYYRVSGSKISGPYSAEISLDSLLKRETVFANAVSDTQKVVLPAKRNPALSWQFDRNAGESGLTSNGYTLHFYGEPQVFETVEFKDAKQFAVLESDKGLFDNARSLSVSVRLSIEKFPTEASYRKNILGKVGFGAENDESAFSLALVKGQCGVEKESFAFFVSNGDNDFATDCDNGIFADAREQNWVYLSASFDNGNIGIYVDGVLVASSNIGITSLRKSSESVYLGKENISMKFASVSLDTLGITEAEAFFEYSKKGGQ